MRSKWINCHCNRLQNVRKGFSAFTALLPFYMDHLLTEERRVREHYIFYYYNLAFCVYQLMEAGKGGGCLGVQHSLKVSPRKNQPLP
jgi:hypothetical protein